MPAHRHLVPPRADRGHLKLTEGELRHWGEELGRSISPPLLVTLTGELGVGKTTLAQAICLGYGVRDEITSPTYALIHEYHAPKSAVFHIDLYRLGSPAQLTNLGWGWERFSPPPFLLYCPARAPQQVPDQHPSN